MMGLWDAAVKNWALIVRFEMLTRPPGGDVAILDLEMGEVTREPLHLGMG